MITNHQKTFAMYKQTTNFIAATHYTAQEEWFLAATTPLVSPPKSNLSNYAIIAPSTMTVCKCEKSRL
jgi:hypothetical protein